MSDKLEKKKFNFIPVIIAAAVLLIGAIVAVIVVLAGSGSRKINAHIKAADKYMSELDYESAIEEYRAIIKIDSKNVEAYLGIASADIKLAKKTDDYDEKLDYLEDAQEVLQDGLDETDDKSIEKKLDKVNEMIDELKSENGSSDAAGNDSATDNTATDNTAADSAASDAGNTDNADNNDASADADNTAVEASERVYSMDGPVYDWIYSSIGTMLPSIESLIKISYMSTGWVPLDTVKLESDYYFPYRFDGSNLATVELDENGFQTIAYYYNGRYEYTNDGLFYTGWSKYGTNMVDYTETLYEEAHLMYGIPYEKGSQYYSFLDWSDEELNYDTEIIEGNGCKIFESNIVDGYSGYTYYYDDQGFLTEIYDGYGVDYIFEWEDDSMHRGISSITCDISTGEGMEHYYASFEYDVQTGNLISTSFLESLDGEEYCNETYYVEGYDFPENPIDGDIVTLSIVDNAGNAVCSYRYQYFEAQANKY